MPAKQPEMGKRDTLCTCRLSTSKYQKPPHNWNIMSWWNI